MKYPIYLIDNHTFVPGALACASCSAGTYCNCTGVYIHLVLHSIETKNVCCLFGVWVMSHLVWHVRTIYVYIYIYIYIYRERERESERAGERESERESERERAESVICGSRRGERDGKMKLRKVIEDEGLGQS